MKELAKRIMFGPPIANDLKNRLKLTTANQTLSDEMNKLNKEVQRLAYRTDPIDDIIRNINKVKVSRRNGSGH